MMASYNSQAIDTESMRFRGKILTLVAIVLGVLLISVAPFLPGRMSDAATLYHMSPGGNDTNPCTASAPCLTMKRAYSVANAGDTVIMAAGDYGNNTWTAPAKSSNAVVTFQPASGAKVKFAYMRFNSVKNIEVRDVETRGWYIDTGSDRITLRNVDSFYGSNFITSATNISVIGGEIAYQDPSDGLQIKRANSSPQVENLLIDGIFMHDLDRKNDPSAHTDCVQLASGVKAVIRNSIFNNCATQGVFVKTFNGGLVDDLLIENNWFGNAQLGYNSLIIESGSPVGTVKNVLIRNNSLATSGRTSTDPAPENVRWIGNISPKASVYHCNVEMNAGVVHKNNLYNKECTGNYYHADLSTIFVNSNTSNSFTFDLHLKPGAIQAMNKLNPSDAAPYDIDGQIRPFGSLADLGADEYGSSPGSPPPSNPDPQPDPDPIPEPTPPAPEPDPTPEPEPEPTKPTPVEPDPVPEPEPTPDPAPEPQPDPDDTEVAPVTVITPKDPQQSVPVSGNITLNDDVKNKPSAIKRVDYYVNNEPVRSKAKAPFALDTRQLPDTEGSAAISLRQVTHYSDGTQDERQAKVIIENEKTIVEYAMSLIKDNRQAIQLTFAVIGTALLGFGIFNARHRMRAIFYRGGGVVQATNIYQPATGVPAAPQQVAHDESHKPQ